MKFEILQLVIPSVAGILAGVISSFSTYLLTKSRNEAEAMKNLLNSCTERLKLIESVQKFHEKYNKVSSEIYEIESNMLSLVLNKQSDKIFEQREKLIDLYTGSLIPAYKYYAEAFFAVYSKSKPDMDFFFESNILDFFNLLMSTVSFVNNKEIFPEQTVSAGITEYDLNDLFRIAKRHIGLFDFNKKKQLKRVRSLIKPFVKTNLPVIPDNLPFQTEKELLVAALSDNLNKMNLEELQKVRDQFEDNELKHSK